MYLQGSKRFIPFFQLRRSYTVDRCGDRGVSGALLLLPGAQ